MDMREVRHDREGDLPHAGARHRPDHGQGERSVAGTLFGDRQAAAGRDLRDQASRPISTATMLYIVNEDAPGFIGRLGTTAGRERASTSAPSTSAAGSPAARRCCCSRSTARSPSRCSPRRARCPACGRSSRWCSDAAAGRQPLGWRPNFLAAYPIAVLRNAGGVPKQGGPNGPHGRGSNQREGGWTHGRCENRQCHGCAGRWPQRAARGLLHAVSQDQELPLARQGSAVPRSPPAVRYAGDRDLRGDRSRCRARAQDRRHHADLDRRGVARRLRSRTRTAPRSTRWTWSASCRRTTSRWSRRSSEFKDAASDAGDNATDSLIDDWTDQAEQRAWFLREIAA